MIAYLDTSALLKLYLEEQGSSQVRNLVAEVAPCTHWLAWVEVHAGLSMAVRMGRLSAAERTEHLRCFDADGRALDVVNLDESLTRRAGTLAHRFGLRAYDSVHLAAPERVMVTVGAADFMFVAFDDKLNAAAGALDMHVPDGRVE